MAEKAATKPALSRDAKPWLDLIKHAETKYANYHDKCDAIDKLYADLEKMSASTADRQFQIFWANLEVLKPAIYSRPPVPVVVPRFKDRKPLPRKASELLERSLSSSFEAEDVDSTMLLVRDDLATNARGVVWERYETIPKPDGSTLEKVCYEHVDRRDFLHSVSRKWQEVDWVARRVWLTRDKGLKRFEKASGKLWLSAEFKSREGEDRQSGEKVAEGEEKAACWELWHKGASLVVWASPGLEDVLDISEPFLSLESFWPCPRPTYGTLQRNSLIPVPDFLYYKDQVEEINELTARISALSEALKLKGFYSAGAGELSDAIETAIKSNDNNAILVPVSNFAALGGASLKDSIVWLPVEQVAEVIAQLVALRKQLIDDVYQLTGLSDIMRGATDPDETLGAQELKSQYGSIRVRSKQEELVRIARDMTRISAEIMAENFAPETLLAMSQIDDLPSRAEVQQQIAQLTGKVQQAARSPQAMEMARANPEQAQQLVQQVKGQIAELEQQITIDDVMELLRAQHVRPFVLDIETDSTIQPDEDAEKQRRTEFLTALGGIMTQLAPLVDAKPEAAPFAAEVLKFAVAPFRAGRELEGVIEEFAEKMKESAGQPKPPPPEQVKAEAEAKALEAETQARQQQSQQDMQARQQEGQIKAQEAETKARTEAEKHAQDMEKGALEIERLQADITRIQAQTEAGFGKSEGGDGKSKPGAKGKGPQATPLQTVLKGIEQLAIVVAQGQIQLSRQMAEDRAQQADQFQSLAQVMAAPKRLLRDEHGRAAGVETITVQ